LVADAGFIVFLTLLPFFFSGFLTASYYNLFFLALLIYQGVAADFIRTKPLSDVGT